MNAMTITLDSLERIYRGAIERCDPAMLLQRAALGPELQSFADSVIDVVAIGKSAARLYRGARSLFRIGAAFVVYPEGYESLDMDEGVEIHVGGHPGLTDDSFAAGKALLHFMRERNAPTLFLISGGASAAVEWPLPGVTTDELAHVNALLVRSGMKIREMNVVRKHLSAIKGGRLREMLTEGSVVGVLSDVDSDDLASVGSGPTFLDVTTNEEAAALLDGIADPIANDLAERLRSELPDTPKQGSNPPAILLGDNDTLLDAATSLAGEESLRIFRADEQLVDDVALVAGRLAATVRDLPAGSVMIAGGEPVVKVSGNGRGGRCSELAARFVRELHPSPLLGEIVALFGSSDGSDGNSGAAGVAVDGALCAADGLASRIDSLVAGSDTILLAPEVGREIMIPPTGNNLRDLYLLARR
jgi:glycerate 2-kinase